MASKPDKRTKRKKASPIVAAGGVVWRATPEGKRIAVVHRSRYDDWTLPKGKARAGEELVDTATREVAEETGCKVSVRGLAGVTKYRVKDRRKTVTYWHMDFEQGGGELDPDEVDRVVWLSLSEALDRLDYPGEVKLLEKIAHTGPRAT